MGPLVDRAHRRAVHAHVVDALGRGATAPCGGRVPDGPGAAYPPTVLVDVAPNSAVLDEETFGPVAPIVAVDSWEEAIAHASSGHHGLAATVLTNDAGHLFDARRLRVGTLKLNAVFGGAPGGAAHPRGSSGNALGYGPELLDELSSVQALHLEAPPHS
jgi:succinate-semialdehyde dehydrogenase/glutarate-semialdehyde dehydrogenase